MNNIQPSASRSQPRHGAAGTCGADDGASARPPAVRALDEDELRLLQARRRVRGLVAQLLARPIDPRTNQALRDYLANEAEPALAALYELASRGPDQLRARINEILTAPRGTLTAPDATTAAEDPAGDPAGEADPRQDAP